MAVVFATIAVLPGLFPAGASAAVALQIKIAGEGKVQWVVEGKECPSFCRVVIHGASDPAPFYPELLAVPADGWAFAGWKDSRGQPLEIASCIGQTRCRLFLPPVFGFCCDDPVTSEIDAIATFVPASEAPPPPSPPAGAIAAIQVRVVGEGAVRFLQIPGTPTSCPPDCQVVTVPASPSTRGFVLNADPAPGWSFAAWSIDAHPGQAAPTLFPPGVPNCTTALFCELNVNFDGGPFDPVGVTATFVPIGGSNRGPDGVFLCYSRFQVDPGVWPEAEAKALLAKGYWRPTAVPGAAVSATRVGPYSLICNPPDVARVVDHGFVDDGGVALAGVGDPWLGLYPLAG